MAAGTGSNVQIKGTGLAAPNQSGRAGLARLTCSQNCWAKMRQPSTDSVRRPAGCETARTNMSSVMSAASSCHGMTPDPRAAAPNSAKTPAGPLIVRWW